MKKYFDFVFPGEKLLIILVLFSLIISIPYFLLVFSVISSGDWSTNDFTENIRFFLLIYIWVFFVLIASVLLRIFILKKFVQATKFHTDFFDFSGSIWKFLWLCVRDGILSLASFGIYYSWFMENIARFIFSNISYLGNGFEFRSRGGSLLKIFLIYYLLPMGIYYYIYFTSFLNEVMYSDPNVIWKIFPRMLGMILIIYVLLIPFCYKCLKWILNLEFHGREIKLHDDSWNSLGIIAREMIITFATFGIYFPAAVIRLYLYFVSHVGISSSQGINFLQFDQISVKRGFKFLWGQIILSFISWGIYSPFAVCKILKWFANKTYLPVYREAEIETELNELQTTDALGS